MTCASCCGAVVIATACGGAPAPSGAGGDAPPAATPQAAASAAASATPPAPAGSGATPADQAPGAALDPAICERIDRAPVAAILGSEPTKTHGERETTASGERVRCDFAKDSGIASIRIAIYPGTTFWSVVVAGDDVGSYPAPFPEWTDSEAKRGVPPTGFAFRHGGGAIDISAIGRKNTTDAQLVALARATVTAVGDALGDAPVTP
jgi:hypothetical protein